MTTLHDAGEVINRLMFEMTNIHAKDFAEKNQPLSAGVLLRGAVEFGRIADLVGRARTRVLKHYASEDELRNSTSTARGETIPPNAG